MASSRMPAPPARWLDPPDRASRLAISHFWRRFGAMTASLETAAAIASAALAYRTTEIRRDAG
jgi:hypothetical protein